MGRGCLCIAQIHTSTHVRIRILYPTTTETWAWWTNIFMYIEQNSKQVLKCCCMQFHVYLCSLIHIKKNVYVHCKRMHITCVDYSHTIASSVVWYCFLPRVHELQVSWLQKKKKKYCIFIVGSFVCTVFAVVNTNRHEIAKYREQA